MPHLYRRINLNSEVISFFYYTNTKENHLKYHDDVYTDPPPPPPPGIQTPFTCYFFTRRKVVNNKRMKHVGEQRSVLWEMCKRGINVLFNFNYSVILRDNYFSVLCFVTSIIK